MMLRRSVPLCLLTIIAAASVESQTAQRMGALGGVGVNAIALHPKTPGHLLAATRTHGLFRSTDDGQTWVPVWTSPLASQQGGVVRADPVISDVVADPGADGHYYMLAEGEGLARSTDGGSTWSRLESPLSTGLSRRSFVHVDPHRRGFLLIGSETHGAHLSMDGGASWSHVVSATVVAFAASRSTGTIYVMSRDGSLLRSDNGGLHWDNGFGDRPAIDVIEAVAVDPDDAEVVYASGQLNRSTPDGQQSYGSAWVTQDGGSSWSEIFSEPGAWISSVFVHPTIADRLILTSSVKASVPGVFESSDRGSSWKQISHEPVLRMKFERHTQSMIGGVLYGLGGVIRLQAMPSVTSTTRATWAHVKDSVPR